MQRSTSCRREECSQADGTLLRMGLKLFASRYLSTFTQYSQALFYIRKEMSVLPSNVSNGHYTFLQNHDCCSCLPACKKTLYEECSRDCEKQRFFSGNVGFKFLQAMKGQISLHQQTITQLGIYTLWQVCKDHLLPQLCFKSCSHCILGVSENTCNIRLLRRDKQKRSCFADADEEEK